jgi:hypothetical protein
MPQERFDRAVAALTAISARDPVQELVDGVPRPRELVQVERLARWVERRAPQPSEALRLAAHCQHVGRFELPRQSYPEGRSGYLRWRSELARRHAETAERILLDAGYDTEMVQRVRRIVLKQSLRDEEVASMEDALCLSFLEHELPEFAERHSDEKLIGILRKSWRKMSPRGHELAAKLSFSERCQALLEKALTPPEAKLP